jgi:hypothetical protein
LAYADAYVEMLREKNTVHQLKSTVEVVLQKQSQLSSSSPKQKMPDHNKVKKGMWDDLILGCFSPSKTIFFF